MKASFNNVLATMHAVTLRRLKPAVLIVCVPAFCATHVFAQPYPAKPVRIFVASGPGSGDDFVARLLAVKLGELMGQQFIIDNRPGAGGSIGQMAAAKSPPDGYTLLLGGGSMAGARYVNAAVQYDVLRDFTPVSLLETSPFVLLVHPSVPAKTAKEYIALARSRPGKMTFGTIGAGQIPYWSVILFNNMARIDAVEVAYKSTEGALIDLISGRVDYNFAPVVAALTNKARLRSLAVTTSARSPMLPDVPAMGEAALPGYEMPAWRSILGPAGMRSEIVEALNKSIRQVMAAPDVRQRMLESGSEPITSTPEELTARFADWVERFGKIAAQAGLKPQ